jgi:hypothetical protein
VSGLENGVLQQNLVGAAGFRNIHIFDRQVSTGMERRALIRLLYFGFIRLLCWSETATRRGGCRVVGGAGHGGKPFLHARKRCAHNVVNRFPLTQFCRLLPDLCCQTFLLHKARAVRGPMISSRGMRPAACSTLRTSQTCSPRRRDQKNASVEKIKGWAKSRLALSKMTISPGADGGQSSIGTLGVIWGGMRAASSARAANLEFTPSLAVLCRSPAASPRYCRASP